MKLLLSWLGTSLILATSLAGKHLRRPGVGGKTGRILYQAGQDATCRKGKVLFCKENDIYRSIDGECNNLKNPYLGAANSSMSRIFEAEYHDCKGDPKGGYEDDALYSRIQKSKNNQTKRTNWIFQCKFKKKQLPNVREVSSIFHPDLNVPQDHFSLMVMQFGQFLDHDLALTPEVEVDDCCEHPDQEDCFPIYIPHQDPFFSTRVAPPTCLEFTRSEASCSPKWPWSAIKKSKRNQFSIVTSFVDGSQIYSANKTEALQLRTHQGGELRTHADYAREMLPVIDGSLKAGDIRALDMPGLATIHTLFIREHNRIARIISAKYKSYDDEEIYQRARRIVIAELQNIVYGEYLPVILGEEAVEKYELGVDKATKYQRKEDPSMINSFTTAAYRFGHSLIQGLVNMADPSDPATLLKTYQLRENFFNMENYLLDDGQGMDRIIAGLIGQEAQTMDRFVTEDVTNFLFFHVGENTGEIKRDFGADLVARNLQRGRDHGLPGYNKYRSFCGLKKIKKFKGRSPPEISTTNWKILAELYNTPDDIDLFVGGLAEFPFVDGLTGPTFNCIKSVQFKRLMDGDRFFFTHENQAGSFTSTQLSQLRLRTLRDIICQNSELSRAKKNVFLLKGDMVDCATVNALDIDIFM